MIIGIRARRAPPSGTSGLAPLDIALQAAEAAGLPLMCHLDFPPPRYEDVVDKLRPATCTHCFRPFPNTPVNSQGNVKDRRCGRERVA